MKKITLIAALAMSAILSFAQVTKGTIGNGNYTDYQQQTSTEFGLDFDNDGNLEIALKTGYDMNTGDPWTNGSIVYDYEAIQLLVASEETWDYFKLLAAGESVSSAATYGGYGDGMFEDISAISTEASYVGFHIIIGESGYYGYAKIHRGEGEIIWDEIYYEATAGKAITAGDTGKPAGIEDVITTKTPEIRKIMIEGIIYIERDGQLFDINGRQVK